MMNPLSVFRSNKFAFLLAILVPLSLQTNADTRITYFHHDNLGSPIAATDESGNVLWRETYAPFGQKVVNSSAAENERVGYTGKLHDNDTGLSYLNARYYDPIVGRFMAVDPVGPLQGGVEHFNKYLYANNNPFRYVDPTGLFSIDFDTGERIDSSFSRGEYDHIASLNGSDQGINSIVDWGFKQTLAGTIEDLLNQLTASEISVTGVLGAMVPIPRSIKSYREELLESLKLYRAVSKAELDDIAENGLRTIPGGYETGKLFATTVEDAAKFGKNNFKLDGIPNHLVEVTVPGSVMKDATKFTADFMDAVSIPADKLNMLNATPLNHSPLVR